MNLKISPRTTVLTCLLLLAPLAASAVQPDEIMTDPRLEARARALSAQLRCMVCQNESIDESHADLARDLRLIIRERLQAGDSDDQICAFLVGRYGDFILLKPPFKL
ncbi:MAG: cytochrome c-type biogenesis protein, partial [Methylocella sp.]